MKKTICLCVTLLIIIYSIIIPVSAIDKSKLNRYNVVFVTDASGSMNNTDPNKLRFEAIDLFVGLIANGGNNVGSVVFGDGVVSKSELIEVKSNSDKKAFTNNLREQPVSGWTDIGGGLITALDLLKNGGNQEIPSIIILLTDGNTEMETSEETINSLKNEEDAMEIARQNGVKIYTVSLNTDNTANSNELKQIASATGGEFKEVSSSSDLQGVFDLYYQMIYSTQSTKLMDEVVPSSGFISRDFEVVDLGVEEVNVVMFGSINSCELKKPNNEIISPSNLDEMLYRTKSFTLLKIEDPDAGIWNLTINAKSGSTIKIFKIYNSNLQIDAILENEKNSYIKDEPINIFAKIKENDIVINDMTRYKGYTATLNVYDYENNAVYSNSLTGDSATSKGYKFTFKPTDYGTYYAQVTLEKDELFTESQKFTFNVGNTPPTVVNELLTKHIKIWPFIIKTDSKIDLSGAAFDNEDDILQYKVKSSTWLEEDYTLSDSSLTIDNFSVSKGSFTIEAFDSMGAFCTFEVQITSTNIGVIAAISIFGCGLLALIIILLTWWYLYNRLFMGTFEIENLMPPYERTTYQKNRGQIKIRALQIGQTGLNNDAHFQATGKNYIYFKSKKPFYNDYTFTMSKKFKIESGVDVRISPTDDFKQGIRVKFNSMLNNRF